MKKDIIVEISRIKEMMGLISEQEQTNESWQSVVGGKPYKLLYETIQGIEGYFSSSKTRDYIESFPKQDTKVTFNIISKYRIPIASLEESTRTFLQNKDIFEISLIDNGFFYCGNVSSFKQRNNTVVKAQENTEFNSKVSRLCLGNVIWEYITKNIYKQGFKLTLNEVRSLNTDVKTGAGFKSGTQFFGTTMPGLSEEILTKFMEFIDEWVKSNAKGNYSANTLYGKIKRGGIRLTPGRPEEVESSEEPTEETFNAIASEFKISADKGSPFVDNKSDLTDVSLGIIKEIANNIQQVIAQNPGTKARVVNKVKVENGEKDIPFTIRTSASRLMNTNEAKDKTFLQLSQERSQMVYQTMQEMLGPLLEGGLPKPIMDFKGTNGDGSSGPNAPNGYSVTTDGRTSTSFKTGSPEANKERNKYGTPPATIKDLDQYKYCIIQIAIEFFSEGESNQSVPGIKDEIFVGKWTFDIIPGDRPKNSSTRKKRYRRQKMSTTYISFGKHELCDAYL
jgi:hypothetical protein